MDWLGPKGAKTGIWSFRTLQDEESLRAGCLPCPLGGPGAASTPSLRAGLGKQQQGRIPAASEGVTPLPRGLGVTLTSLLIKPPLFPSCHPWPCLSPLVPVECLTLTVCCPSSLFPWQPGLPLHPRARRHRVSSWGPLPLLWSAACAAGAPRFLGAAGLWGVVWCL